LEVIHGSVFEPAIKIALYTGLRVGELTALTFSDVDEVNGVLHINKTLVYYPKSDGKCGMSIHSTKTKAGTRDLPLTKEILSMIKLQKKLNEQLPKCCSVDGIDDFIFVTRVGTPHRQDTLNRALRRIVDTANDEAGEGDVLLPRFSMHKLRKTACTNAVAAGASLEQIAKWLGHSDFGITSQIYSQARMDIQLDTSRKAIEGMPSETSETSTNNDAENEPDET
jgi:integrase